MSVHDLDPGSEAAKVAPSRFLIGEPGEPAEMAPVGTGRIAAVQASALAGNGGGDEGLQGRGADVNPGLQMAGTGLEHQAGTMPMVAHAVEDAGIGTVEIEQDIARVLVEVVRVNIDIESLAVADAQEAYVSRMEQLGRSPQALSRQWAAGLVVNQAQAIEVVRHGGELAADGLCGEGKSAVRI